VSIASNPVSRITSDTSAETTFQAGSRCCLQQEVLSEPAPLPTAAPTPETVAHETDEPSPLALEVHSEPEVELASEAEPNPDPLQAHVAGQEPRRRGGLIGMLFGRQK
jgi:hypothetical protein